MFDRFTDKARLVMETANQEAHRFNSNYIETGHILIALTVDGVTTKVLDTLGVDRSKVRAQAEARLITWKGRVITGDLTPNVLAENAIEYAVDEAKYMGHNYVGTEHLLLGLLRKRDGMAAQVLRNLGLEIEETRAAVLDYLGGRENHSAPEPTKQLLACIEKWRQAKEVADAAANEVIVMAARLGEAG